MRLRLPSKSFAVRLRHAAPTFNLEEVRTYDAPADVGGPQERVESDTRANGGRPVAAHTRAGVRLRHANPTFNLEASRLTTRQQISGGPQERVEPETCANGGRPVVAHTCAGVWLRAARGKSDEAPQPGTGRLEVTKRRRVPVRPFCTTFDQAKNLGLGLGLGWNLNPKPRKR